MDGGEPDIPIYKVIECTGPTNTRIYKVAVYFRGKRLASSTGHSIQQAEMEAAKKALENSSEINLFPQLDYQKRVMAKTLRVGMKRQKVKPFDNDRKGGRGLYADQQKSTREHKEDDSNLPKQYRYQSRDKPNANDSDGSLESDTDSLQSSHSGCSSKYSTNGCIGKKDHRHEKYQSNLITTNEDQNIDENTAECDESNSIEKDKDHEKEQEKKQNFKQVDENYAKHNLNAIKDTDCIFTSKIGNDENNSDTDVSLESGEIL